MENITHIKNTAIELVKQKKYSECYNIIKQVKQHYKNTDGLSEYIRLYYWLMSLLIYEQPEMIPSYFIHMMNDERRVIAFKSAMERVIKPESNVMEIGAGTGIMSCLASRIQQNKKTIYCYEVNPVLADVVRNVVKDNQCNVKVIEKMSNCGNSDEIEGRKDVLICETIGNYLLAEDMIKIVNDAFDRYLVPDATVIPSRGRLYGYLGYSETNYQLVKSKEDSLCGIDISYFKNIISETHIESKSFLGNISSYNDTIKLSDSKLLFDFNFCKKNLLEDSTTVKFKVKRNGILTGLVLHFELDTIDNVIIKSGVENGSWEDNILGNSSQFFIPVYEGQEIKLKVSYTNGKNINVILNP